MAAELGPMQAARTNVRCDKVISLWVPIRQVPKAREEQRAPEKGVVDMSRPHNCRHCSHMVCGDANWCSEHEEVMGEYEIWAARKCPEWEWNPIDALTLKEHQEHIPEGRRCVLDGQTRLELS